MVTVANGLLIIGNSWWRLPAGGDKYVLRHLDVKVIVTHFENWRIEATKPKPAKQFSKRGQTTQTKTLARCFLHKILHCFKCTAWN